MKNCEEDPLLQELLREQEAAFRAHRRALIDLRRLYSTTDNPDVIRAAALQQVAHDAEHRLADANHALTRYSWEIVPFNRNSDHLDKIKLLREAALQRISAIPKVKEEGGPVVIITTINGVKKRFIE